MLLLPSRVPNFHLRDRIIVDAHVCCFSISAMSFYFLYFEWSIGVHVLHNEGCLAHVDVPQHCYLNGCWGVLRLLGSFDHCVPHIFSGLVGRCHFREHAVEVRY